MFFVPPYKNSPSTAQKKVCGSSPLSFAVLRSEAKIAQLSAPPSLPLNNEFFLPSAITRSFCPCRAGVGSPLPLASLFWPQGRHPAHSAASDGAISEHHGS